MEPKLREYVENLFASAPKTREAYELKEEIICNIIDRYHDLIAEGKTEGNAYNQAVAGIGNIEELISELGGEPVNETDYTDEEMQAVSSRCTLFKSIAIALYILCVTPCIIFGLIPSLETVGPVFMFLMISVATGLIIYSRRTRFTPVMKNEEQAKHIKRLALMRAVSIGMYISCVTPCIALGETALAEISPIFMFMLIAAATVLIILSKDRQGYKRVDDTMVESFKEFRGRKKSTSALYKVLVAILWVTVSLIYCYIPFAAGLASVTVSWIIFIIAVAIQQLMRAIFDYVEASK